MPANSASRIESARAFSLVELAFVMAIIAIVCAIALPKFSNSIQRQRASAAARRIAADLNMARSRANTTSTTVAVTFTFKTNQYQIPGVQDLEKPLNTYTVKLTDEPYYAKIISSNLGGVVNTSGSASVSFSGFGLPSAGGTLTIASGAEKRNIIVDAASGRALVQ